MAKKSNAERLMILFKGNESHSGTHGVPDMDANGVKWGIKRTARTIKGETTKEMWESHLSGKRPLGIVPIMNDSKCVWGSIDIDDYDIEVLDVIKQVEKLPLVPCRSKSGGLHLFLFVKDPVEASLMQSTLRDIAASIGFATSEVFPKQTRLLVDQGDMGNWIVMPYFGDTYDGKLRWQRGIKSTGAEMTVEEFCSLAEKKSVPSTELSVVRREKKKTAKKEKKPFSDGPPCLVHLASMEGGIPQGGQNNTAFHMGVYFKRSSPENWERLLEEANQKYMSPPLPSDNLSQVIKSLNKKDYQYKCKDQPMINHCDAMQCRTRKYGVGAGGTYPQITGISKLNTEPAIWFVDVEGTRLSMSTSELQDYRKFCGLCLEYTHKSFAVMSQNVWAGVLNDALQNITLIPAPDDVGQSGQFLEAMEQFLTNRQRGKEKEDLLSGRPWEDEEHGRHYFQLASLQKFLDREGLKKIAQHRGDITQRIEKLGGGHHPMNIKGYYRNYWWIPSEAIKTVPESGTPELKESSI